MSNKLHCIVTVFFLFSSFSLIIASEATQHTATVRLPQAHGTGNAAPNQLTEQCSSPRPPREISSWFGQAHHQLKKRENPYAYATDGGHLEILTYLEAAGKTKEFYIDANFLSQLSRSVGRSCTAGAEILVNIEARNIEKLKKLFQKNKQGLPQYLINAINTITNPPSYSLQESDPPPIADDTLFGQALGFFAKQWNPNEYVFRPDAKELSQYLIQTSKSSHCSDQHFKIHVERALKRMRYVHDYLRDRIAERNTINAQDALDHNRDFLPVAHTILFQRAIDELREKEQIGRTEAADTFEVLSDEESPANAAHSANIIPVSKIDGLP